MKFSKNLFMALFLVIGMVVIGKSNNVFAAGLYEQEKNDDYASASVLLPNSSVTGNISDDDDKDYYVVQPTANGKLELTFNHIYQNRDAHWKVSIYLYDSGIYTELSYLDIGLKDDEKIELPSVGMKKSGLYYIVVAKDSWYGDGVIGVDYSIASKFMPTEDYEKELNDVYGTATPLNIGKTMHGNISAHYDKDYYKIVMPSTGYYRLNFKHTYQDSSGGWSVRVYKASGGKYTELSNTRISLNSSNQTNLPSVGMTAGASYYIKVEDDYDAIGCDYSLKVSLSANGPAVINTISMKKAIKISWLGVSGANGYEVYYKIGKTGKYKKFKSTKKTSVKFANAKKGKKYYFKVRGYVKSGGKTYYSVFSKAKSAKCK